MSRLLNEFIKGFLWGFVGFVHVFMIAVVIYKLKLNCLPARYVEMLACLPAGSARCPNACDPSLDGFFYVLAFVTAGAAVFLPLGLASFWVIKSRSVRV